MWQDLWKSLDGIWSRNRSQLVQISGIDFSSLGVCLWAGNLVSICNVICDVHITQLLHIFLLENIFEIEVYDLSFNC